MSKRSLSTSAVDHRTGPPGWVFQALLVSGAISVIVSTLAASAIYLMSGKFYALMVPVALAVISLVAMGLRSRATLKRCLRRLAPIAAFALLTVAVAAIAAIRMQSGLAGTMRYAMGPESWFSAAVLGYMAGRSKIVPLVVATTVALISALIGLLSFFESAGMSTSLGQLHVAWLAAVGAWAPGPSEMFRAVGLDLDPNTYGLIGAVALVALVCIDGPVWLRALGGASAGSVLVLSGSRTAIVATVVGLAVAALVQLADSRSRDHRESFGIVPALAGMLIAVVLLGATVTVQAGPGAALQRLGLGASGLAAGGGAASPSAVAIASSGRTEIWTRALEVYARYPLGAFLQPESLVGRSIHNEYLERLLFGGPVLVAAFIGLLVWIATRLRPATAPSLGPTMCAVYAVSAFTLGPSLLPAFLGLGFYLVGWGSAQPDGAAVRRVGA